MTLEVCIGRQTDCGVDACDGASSMAEHGRVSAMFSRNLQVWFEAGSNIESRNSTIRESISEEKSIWLGKLEFSSRMDVL